MAGYSTCSLCGRKQSLGILSRGMWGTVSSSDGTTTHACPTCMSEYADWEARLQEQAGAGGSAGVGASPT
jgi:hypothetical protein